MKITNTLKLKTPVLSPAIEVPAKLLLVLLFLLISGTTVNADMGHLDPEVLRALKAGPPPVAATAQSAPASSLDNRIAMESRESQEQEESPNIQNSRIRKAQFRKTIAVARFENRTTAAGQINLGSGMADQLTNALVQSDNFVVLERKSVADVLNEQDFARSGRTQASTVARTGKVVPAQILIKGVITEFQLQESGTGAGVSYMGFSLGTESSTAHVGLILRIIDTTSGQVLDSVRMEGKATGTGYKLGVSYQGLGIEAEQFQNTALNRAVHLVINQAVKKIADNLNEIPFEGKIIKVKGDTFYTNIGSRNNVFGGDMFHVYSPGTELIDPDTGEKLGSIRKKVGMVVVSTPEEKYSKAFASNGQVFKAGYILVEKSQTKKSASASDEVGVPQMQLAKN